MENLKQLINQYSRWQPLEEYVLWIETFIHSDFGSALENYPKWFYYQWCIYHLDRFIAIAQAHATTMGHIKRKDLDNAMCFVPSDDEMKVMDKRIVPLMEKLENNSKQIKTLENMRDTLLPKLMSGEVRVKF